MNVPVRMPLAISPQPHQESISEDPSRREWLLRGWRMTPEESELFETPLLEFFAAVREGRTEGLRQHLNDHPDWVVERGPYSMDALMFAAQYGHASCVQLLLERGARPARQAMERDALRWALKRGHVDCVQLLLPTAQGGTRCDHFLWLLSSVSHRAKARQLTASAMVSTLRAHDTRWPDLYAYSPLHFVCTFQSLEGLDLVFNRSLPEGVHGPIDARAAEGAAQAVDRDKCTPLILWMDIDKSRDLRVYDSPLHQDERFRQFLRLSPIKHLGENKKDALDYAIEHGYLFAALALLRKPNREKAARSSLQWLEKREAHGFLELIARFDREQREERVLVGHWGAADQPKVMRAVGPSVRKRQWQRLKEAIESDNVGAIEALLSRSPALAKRRNLVGETPLLYAARRSKLKALAQLLPQSDRLVQRHDGLSALMLCLLDRHDEGLQAAATQGAELLLQEKIEEQARLESVAGHNAVSFGRLHQNAWALKTLLPHSSALVRLGAEETPVHVLNRWFDDFEEECEGETRAQLGAVLDELVQLCPLVPDPTWNAALSIGYESAMLDLLLAHHKINARQEAQGVNEKALRGARQSLLALACGRSSLHACQLILKDPQAAALLSAPDARWNQETPLHCALEGADEETLRWLLAQPQVGPHVRTEAMGSLLSHAVRVGSASLLRVLLEVWGGPQYHSKREDVLKGVHEGLRWLFDANAFEQEPSVQTQASALSCVSPTASCAKRIPARDGAEGVHSVNSSPVETGLNLWQELFGLLWSVAKTDAKLRQWTAHAAVEKKNSFVLTTLTQELSGADSPPGSPSSECASTPKTGKTMEEGIGIYLHHEMLAPALSRALLDGNWPMALQLAPFVSGAPLIGEIGDSSALMLAAPCAPLEVLQALAPAADVLQCNADGQSALGLAVAAGNTVNAQWLASRGCASQWLERDRNGLVPLTRYILRCSEWCLLWQSSEKKLSPLVDSEVFSESPWDDGEGWRKENDRHRPGTARLDPEWARWAWEQTQAASEEAGCAGLWIEQRSGLLHRLLVGLPDVSFAREWIEKTLNHVGQNHQSYSGETALMLALKKKPDTLGRVLLLRADPALHVNNNTPLIWAAACGWIEELAMLMPKSSLDCANKSGRTALDVAVRNGNLECAQRLWEAQTGALKEGEDARKIKERLLALKGAQECSLLHRAALSGNIEVLEWVIGLSSCWPISWAGIGPLFAGLVGSAPSLNGADDEEEDRKATDPQWMGCFHVLYEHYLGLHVSSEAALQKWEVAEKGALRFHASQRPKQNKRLEDPVAMLTLMMSLDHPEPHHHWLQQELLKLVPPPHLSSHPSKKSLWVQSTELYEKKVESGDRDAQGSWFMKGLRQHEAWRERQALATFVGEKSTEMSIENPVKDSKEQPVKKQTKRL